MVTRATLNMATASPLPQASDILASWGITSQVTQYQARIGLCKLDLVVDLQMPPNLHLLQISFLNACQMHHFSWMYKA